MMKTAALILVAMASFATAQSRVGAFSMGKSLGNPQAPIRIELFNDFQCPGCKVLHEQTLKPLIDAYVKTGKVYLVQREYPLVQIHPHALEAARIACAAEQLAHYNEICDQLFRTQERWTKSGDVIGAACSILSPAEAKRLRQLAASPQVAQTVDQEMRLGQTERVNGTPTMVITKMVRRYPVSGPVSYAVLSRFVDSLLQ